MQGQDPGLPNPEAADSTRRRPGKQYTLPKSVATSESWRNSGLPVSDLTFVLVTPSTDDEEEARKFAKGDPIKMADRMQDRCLAKIGGHEVRMNHALLKKWKDAIDIKGRKLVETRFLEMFQTSTEDEEEMTASGKDVYV